MNYPEQLLTTRDVCKISSLSRASVERMVKDGRLPKPIRLSERRKAFKASEIYAWMTGRETAQ